MRRLFLLGPAVIIICLLISGCGSSSTAPSPYTAATRKHLIAGCTEHIAKAGLTAHQKDTRCHCYLSFLQKHVSERRFRTDMLLVVDAVAWAPDYVTKAADKCALGS